MARSLSTIEHPQLSNANPGHAQATQAHQPIKAGTISFVEKAPSEGSVLASVKAERRMAIQSAIGSAPDLGAVHLEPMCGAEGTLGWRASVRNVEHTLPNGARVRLTGNFMVTINGTKGSEPIVPTVEAILAARGFDKSGKPLSK